MFLVEKYEDLPVVYEIDEIYIEGRRDLKLLLKQHKTPKWHRKIWLRIKIFFAANDEIALNLRQKAKKDKTFWNVKYVPEPINFSTQVAIERHSRQSREFP